MNLVSAPNPCRKTTVELVPTRIHPTGRLDTRVTEIASSSQPSSNLAGGSRRPHTRGPEYERNFRRKEPLRNNSSIDLQLDNRYPLEFRLSTG